MKRLLFITGLLVSLSNANSEECRGECTLIVGCWLAGGYSLGSCPDASSFTSWMYTCCTYKSRSQSPYYPQQLQQPQGYRQPPQQPPPPPPVYPQQHQPYFLPPHLYNFVQSPYKQQYPPLQQPHPPLQQPLPPFAQLQLHQPPPSQSLPQLAYQPQLHRPPNQLFRRTDTPTQRQVQCGVPALTLQKRIIGGSEAYFGELPWQAHLRIGGYQCGGALVSRKHVITAAHCVHRAQLPDIIIYLGEYDTQNTGYEPYPEEAHRVIQKYVHPNFQFRLAQPDRYDVALVRLAKGIIFKENILPICLPKSNINIMGKTGLVAGWGKTDTTYGKTGTNILRKAVVPILTDAECLKWHRHKNIRVELHQEMFCAGHSDGRMDACLGDSGGPLIVMDNGHWTLAGITSAGFGCAVDHQPGIYHKVQFTADWINMVIATT